MPDNLKHEHDEKKHKPDHKHPHPHHDVAPHILKEIMDLKEKVGRLEGQMEVLLKMQK